MKGIHLSLSSAILAIIIVFLLAFSIMKRKRGNEQMVRISRAIQVGAQTFLKREYYYVSFVVVIIVILFSLSGILSDIGLDWRTALSFFIGVSFSALAGYVAMWIGTRANTRTTCAFLTETTVIIIFALNLAGAHHRVGIPTIIYVICS